MNDINISLPVLYEHKGIDTPARERTLIQKYLSQTENNLKIVKKKT